MHRTAIVLLFVALAAAKLNLPTTFYSVDAHGKLSFSGQTAVFSGHTAANDQISFSSSNVQVAGQNISSDSVIFASNHTAYTWDAKQGCRSVHLNDQQYAGTRYLEYVNEHAEPIEGACSGSSEEGKLYTIKFPGGAVTPFGDYANLCASKDGKTLFWVTVGNTTDKVILENFHDSAPELEYWQLPAVCYDAGKRLSISTVYSYKYAGKNTDNGAVTKVTEGSVHRTAVATIYTEKSGASENTITWFAENTTAYYDYHSFCFASNVSSLYSDQLSNKYFDSFALNGPCEYNGKPGHLWTWTSSTRLCTCEQNKTPYYYESGYSNRTERVDFLAYEPTSDAVAQLSAECAKASPNH